MSDNVRFHSKWHGKNHHTLATPGYYDSARDPIAGPGQEFMGDFYLSGGFVAITTPSLSANLGARDILDLQSLRTTTIANSANWITGSKWGAFGTSIALSGVYTKVGIGINNPAHQLSVLGSVSASSVVYAGPYHGIEADRASSNAWNYVAANSGGLLNNLSEVAANSAFWNSTYYNMLNDVIPNSANWNSTYLQVQDSTTDLNVDSNTLFVDKSLNVVAIGSNTPSATSKLTVDTGGTSNVAISANGTIQASGDITAFSTSDRALKDNIAIISDPIAKIQSINGVVFEWNKQAPDHLKGNDYGVIAQEIEEVLPLAVTVRDTGYKAVKYDKIIPLLIEAIKDQQKQIDELKKAIEI